MRSCLTPIAILAAILAFALWNGSHMADSTDRWRDQLQQVDALAQAEAWTEALDALAESYEWAFSSNLVVCLIAGIGRGED